MKNRFYLLLCAARGPGGQTGPLAGRWTRRQCLQQTVACVLAAVYVTDEELSCSSGATEKLRSYPRTSSQRNGSRTHGGARSGHRRPRIVH